MLNGKNSIKMNDIQYIKFKINKWHPKIKILVHRNVGTSGESYTEFDRHFRLKETLQMRLISHLHPKP